MEPYTYIGNRDGNNTSEGLVYTGPDGKAQGRDRSVDGLPPIILPGDEIKLTAGERDRLAAYVILENRKGDEVEGQVPDTALNLSNDPELSDVSSVAEPVVTSETDGTVGSKSTSSSKSKN